MKYDCDCPGCRSHERNVRWLVTVFLIALVLLALLSANALRAERTNKQRCLDELVRAVKINKELAKATTFMVRAWDARIEHEPRLSVYGK